MRERPFPEERYKAITLAMVHPDKRQARIEVLTLVRKVERRRDMADFFDHADEAALRTVEQHLGIDHGR